MSAQDIRDVIEGHQVFLHGTDAKALTDRTLYRPELANADSDVEEISEFYYELAAAERFLHRLPSRIRTHSSVASLEKPLSVADTRAAQLRESWPSARAAARRLSAND
ncbi:hypothetical protein [Corynebacterium argentoratense]|uniref:hypothetical protein n=1 Tax=Corynebacterium argentoratense TaxID=42817 RepID=UPI0028D8E777|nr:hypothetical protein [Corynebacterium argentoratense]